ncbi:hypothetical protein TNIN_177511 [Trichonephila inaurata madagascariensis]|uniref:Uncharacterized protein n=1 Tax=Trichonephila inaurata madagascariensis TaxID=2747483 RepID=A0A8X6YSS3_9ARAC|nr:hypothetical protein TNIN_177511 [Trichonephila inaurata madagascariensis]
MIRKDRCVLVLFHRAFHNDESTQKVVPSCIVPATITGSLLSEVSLRIRQRPSVQWRIKRDSAETFAGVETEASSNQRNWSETCVSPTGGLETHIRRLLSLRSSFLSLVRDATPSDHRCQEEHPYHDAQGPAPPRYPAPLVGLSGR